MQEATFSRLAARVRELIRYVDRPTTYRPKRNTKNVGYHSYSVLPSAAVPVLAFRYITLAAISQHAIAAVPPSESHALKLMKNLRRRSTSFIGWLFSISFTARLSL